MLEQLLSGDENTFNNAWRDLCFDAGKMVALKAEVPDEDTANRLLAAGSNYLGCGWCTSREFRKLFENTGVAIVSAEFGDYQHSFLFGLAIFLGVEVPTFVLSDKQAEAAYALAAHAETIMGQPGHTLEGLGQITSGKGEDNNMLPNNPGEEEEEEDEEAVFGWEEPTVEAPKELQELWGRAASGTYRIEMRKLLEKYPMLRGLPRRAPENNMKGDSKKREDKFLKVIQQHLLHILRVQAHLLASPSQATTLQLWQYIAELYHKVLQERKELSLPGFVGSGKLSHLRESISHRSSAAPQEVLFSKEDVQNVKAERAINSIGVEKMGVSNIPLLGRPFRSGNRQPRFGYQGS